MNRPRSGGGLEVTESGVVPAPRKHPEERRERAIRFALDLVEGPEKLSVNAACKRVGEQLGIVPDSLRNWVQRPASTTARRRG